MDFKKPSKMGAVFDLRALSLLALVFLCASCSFTGADLGRTEIFHAVSGEDEKLQTVTPVFRIKEAEKAYNRIGTPQVRKDEDGELDFYVEPAQAAIYWQEQQFVTERGQYRNLIFRVHFEEVPFSLSELHLGAGKNPGLIVIVTFDGQGEAVLVTTVHTCGCYLAFFPTEALPRDCWPEDWSEHGQIVYGKPLPSLLAALDGQDERLLVAVDGGDHRVSDVQVLPAAGILDENPLTPMALLPMESLWRLEYGDQRLSFFELEGPRQGYVKNSFKPLERFLISWWAFDWHVGEDKALGDREKTGTIFYTSLKFWRREESDLWEFPSFLKHWGWGL